LIECVSFDDCDEDGYVGDCPDGGEGDYCGDGGLLWW
jgi:hypothetical protein